MNIDDIRHVFVIGAGTMGRQIALRCAVEGYEVTVYECLARCVAESRRTVAKGRCRASAAEALDPGQFGSRPLARSLHQQSGRCSHRRPCERVVPEDPDLKAKVFALFAEVCPPRTIFTTNTSTLVPSQYASATGRPDRFAAMHFYNVWRANLLDIMPHPGTSQETVQLLRDFAKKIGQVPMVFKKKLPHMWATILRGC